MRQNRIPLELYVHIPFCVRKCAYCDFVSGPAPREVQRAYLAAVQREIEAVCRGEERNKNGAEFRSEENGGTMSRREEKTADRFCPETYEVVSVFFGGGTPSVPDPELLAETLLTLRKHFYFRADAEITLEANPGTVEDGRLAVYRAAGFNRISLGCQSVHDEELRRLGRIHTFREFVQSFEAARQAGFANINVDLMSGLPGQSLESWEESLRVIAGMRPEHISAYSLIVEPGTPFAEQELDLPDEETERRMYERTAELLAAHGYRQYEISNYALPGYACRHNVGYWTRTEYLGFGVAAASLIRDRRWTNTGELDEYLRYSGEPERIRRQEETLSRNDCMEEFMFLGLRMTEGIRRGKFRELFGVNIEQIYGPVLKRYGDLGLLALEGDRIAFTRVGISVSNTVLADFLLD